MTPERPPTVSRLEPGIRRVLAPNPSPMTHWGTNTYIVGEGEVAVIDPGPADTGHLRAIFEALSPGERVAAILVTHSHVDHSPLAALMAERTGAPIVAFGSSSAGRSPVMERLAGAGVVGGGEGVDLDFAPHESLVDGARIDIGDIAIRALHTPGHMGNHLCFEVADALFTGDHVMGWASSLVSPPDGDLTDFMASTRRLARRNDRIFYPGHGDPVDDPGSRLDWLIAHRLERERAILEALEAGHRTLEQITRTAYPDVPEAMLPMAARNAFAHLVDLTVRGLAVAEPELAMTAEFAVAGAARV